MTSLTGRRIGLVCCLTVPLIPARGAEAQAPTDETYPLVRVIWQPFRVMAVESDGTIRLEPAAIPSPIPPPDSWVVTEGHYLVVSPQFLPGPMLSSMPRQLFLLSRYRLRLFLNGGNMLRLR